MKKQQICTPRRKSSGSEGAAGDGGISERKKDKQACKQIDEREKE